MEIFSSYNLIIEASVIIILSFLFGELSKRTNIPSVLMLILLGIGIKAVMDASGTPEINFLPILEVIGIIGLIMIVLEAALELELHRDKLIPITKAFTIALLGLLLSAYVAAMILLYFIPEMTSAQAWIYATPISILSSAIIIPSVNGLRKDKKEFHIYESTFGDILGIVMFYFLAGQFETGDANGGATGLFLSIVITIVISVIASYLMVYLFQHIKSHVKLFLLISVLLLLYAVGKKFHLSSLLIILIFGLMIANMELFFKGKLASFLHLEKAKSIYEGLHVITLETSFVIRTFFFVIFGLTISLTSLLSLQVALISLLVIVSIYVIRYVLLRVFIGKNIQPQTFIAPRGLVTVLLFYAIPQNALFPGFEPGILLFIILGTSLLMTYALIRDKKRNMAAVDQAKSTPIATDRWTPPEADDMAASSNAH